MRALLAVLALAVAVSAYIVPESDKICSTDADCTFIDVNCPGVCGCSFQTVNTSRVTATQEILAKTCPAYDGPQCMIACASPLAPVCSKSTVLSPKGTTGICTFGEIVKPSTVCEVRNSCQGVPNMCVNSMLPIMDCAPLPIAKRDAELQIVYTCEDVCLAKAVCTKTPGTVDGCSFQNSPDAPKDGITYEQCVSKCKAVETPSSTVVAPSGISLEGECTAMFGCNPLVDNRCTADVFASILCAEPVDGVYTLTCQDKCLERAECKQTPGTSPNPKQCSFQDSALAPKDGVTYTQCVKNCETSGCPNGNAPAKCPVDPCAGKTCPNNPNAVCSNDYCDGCNAISFTVNGVPVNCDPVESPCSGLGCDGCLARSDCTYCSGSIASFCSAKNSLFAEACSVKASGAIVTSATTCPVFGGVESQSPIAKVNDTTDFQKDIDSTTKPILEKFDVLVTLIVKETPTNTNNGFEILKLFIELFGTSAPTEADKTAVCELLKSTAAKRDATIPLDKLNCSLLPTSSPVTKRQQSSTLQASLVGQLTYPSATNNVQTGAASVVAPAVVALVAAVAALF